MSRAPTAHQYRVTIPPNHVVWANDGGTMRRLPSGATINTGDLKPDTIRTGLAEGWLERAPAKGAPAEPVKSHETPEPAEVLDIDEPEPRENMTAEERTTTAHAAAPKNKARKSAPKTKTTAPEE
ncbi:MAG: hypothetical protein WC972_14025 [Trueperaceae bacterium]